MKKLLFVVLSFSLALLFALSGCSCATPQPLSFNRAYLGEGSGYYSEELEYSVGYESTYQSITNSAGVDQSKIPEFNGTYVVNFSNKNNHRLPEGVTTDLDYELDYHYIKSTLSLSFTVNNKTYNDQIVSEVYFHSKDWSLAPVYSKTTMKYTYLFVDAENDLSQIIYQFSTTYKKNGYISTKTFYQPEENEDVNLIDITDTDVNSPSYFDTQKLKAMAGNGKSHEYDLQAIVDNNQLMFAIRNSNLGSVKLPTVSFSYDAPVDITAQNRNQANYTIENLIYNGENKDNTNMPINNVEFYINATNNRGSSKYMSIQREAVNGISNNALIVEYAEPLLSGLSNIGALVYKLNKVTIINN